MSALPIHASLDIKAASSADAIAVSYSKNSDGNFEFVSPLTADIEKFFGVDLGDELSFFSPTGKAGELFEIPVSAPDAATDPAPTCPSGRRAHNVSSSCDSCPSSR